MLQQNNIIYLNTNTSQQMSEESITSTINRYNDVFLQVPSHLANLQEHYFEKEGVKYDPNQGYVVHFDVSSAGCTPLVPNDFRYITTRDNKAIYVNNTAFEKAPKIINNAVSGAVMVLTVSLETSPSRMNVVFVKDRTKSYYTNPAGSREPNESFEQCAIRETFEETGVRVNTALTQIGSFGYLPFVFEMKWDGIAIIYHAHATLKDVDFEHLKQFSCDEIEKVHVEPVTKNGIEISKIEDVPISDHHRLAANYILAKNRGEKLDWKADAPTYLKDFKLQ